MSKRSDRLVLKLAVIAVALAVLPGCATKIVDNSFWLDIDDVRTCMIKQDFDIDNPPTVGELLFEYEKAVQSCRASQQQLEAFRRATKRLKTQ